MIRKRSVSLYLRALRLPFLSVSVLPFVFGSLIFGSGFLIRPFLLGFTAVVFSHLSANLLNDYSDSKSGVDWQDTKFYGFFGGSKLIQEGVFSETWYLKTSLFCSIIAFLSVVLLSVTLHSLFILIMYLLILGLYFSYSHLPFRLAYHKLGELVIFILFGPALVMGGYFIQTRVFADAKSFILSLPFGFLTTAILFSNEIPDFEEDKKANKITWVDFFGKEKAFIGYYILSSLAGLAVLVSVVLGYLNVLGLVSLFFFLLFLKSGHILKDKWADKESLAGSSRLTILAHFFISLTLIMAVLL